MLGRMIRTSTRRSTTGGNSTLHPASSSSLSRPMGYQPPCLCFYIIGAKYTRCGMAPCSKRTMRAYGRYLSEFVTHCQFFFSSDDSLPACCRKWHTISARQFPPFTRNYWIVYYLSFPGLFPLRLLRHCLRPFLHFFDTSLYLASTPNYWIKHGRKYALYYRNVSEKSNELWPRFGVGC